MGLSGSGILLFWRLTSGSGWGWSFIIYGVYESIYSIVIAVILTILGDMFSFIFGKYHQRIFQQYFEKHKRNIASQPYYAKVWGMGYIYSEVFYMG